MPYIEITQHPSNTKRRKRKGRGCPSGLGKTSGRGQTGQKSRPGGTPGLHFEGGQNPLVRKFPKNSGFKRHSKVIFHPININELEEVAADGTTVDLAFLDSHGMLPKKRRGLRVKLLGNGEISKKLSFQLHAFSNSAKEKVEKAGGSCEVID